MLGPAGGGALIGIISWRAIFWVNIPLIAATVVLTLHAVQESRDPDAFRGIDWLGILLSAVGLGGPAFALIEQPTHGWSDPLVWVPLVVGDRLLRALHPLRGARPPPDARPRPLPDPQLRGRQPDHALGLRGADRRPLLRRPLPPAGRRLLAARGRPGDDADLDPAVLPLAALRQARLRHRAAAADDAPARSSAALGLLLLLRVGADADYVTDVLPGAARLRPRPLGDGGAADRDRARLGRRTPRRHRLRRQQRRLPGRRAAGDRRPRRRDLGPLRLRPRPRARHRAARPAAANAVSDAKEQPLAVPETERAARGRRRLGSKPPRPTPRPPPSTSASGSPAC